MNELPFFSNPFYRRLRSARRWCGKGFLIREMLFGVVAFLAGSLLTAVGVSSGGTQNATIGVEPKGSITGTVRNRSRNQPSAGDDVILLRLDDQGMPEEAHAKTDEQGTFVFPLEFPDKPHLVRVMHANVNYDERVLGRNLPTLEVFDAIPQVQGITGSIEILRTGTSGKRLHVSDMYEIRNDSNPPMTQAGERTFDVYLLAKAKIDSVLAAGPGKMGVVISAKPVAGEPGHFTVDFPLRPGATKFAFNYDVPYSGHIAFETRHEYPTQQMAVMIPPTMKFSSSNSFQLLPIGNKDSQVQAVSPVKAGAGPVFELSGTGAQPQLSDPAKSQQARAQTPPPMLPNSTVAAPPSLSPPPVRASRPPATVTRVDTSLGKPLSSSQLFILSGMGVVLLVVCAFLVWRTKARSKTKQTANFSAAATNPPLLDALKEELFRLETDRLHGAISKEEYQATRQTLEAMVKRTVAKTGTS